MLYLGKILRLGTTGTYAYVSIPSLGVDREFTAELQNAGKFLPQDRVIVGRIGSVKSEGFYVVENISHSTFPYTAEQIDALIEAMGETADENLAVLAGRVSTLETAPKVLAQTDAPSDTTILWIDTSGEKNVPKVFSSGSWNVVSESAIKVAMDAAIAAQTSANNAQTSASNAQTSANNANTGLSQVISRGTDLIMNGSGMLAETLTPPISFGMAAMTLNPTDVPTGATNSFVAQTGLPRIILTHLVPYDPAKAYKFSYQAKQMGSSTTAKHYGMIVPFDASGASIVPYHYMFTPGTTTTLAQDLNRGDTQIKLTSAAGWYGATNKPAGTNTHLRSMVIWNWTDSFGKTWPAETYSRNYWKIDAWSDGGVDVATNTITLKTPWAGDTVLAGTPVSNGKSGGSYIYMPNASGVPVPKEWTSFSAIYPARPSNASVDKSLGARWPMPNSDTLSAMPPGTAQIAVGWLLNYTDYENSLHAVANISLSDSSAAQDFANTAQTVAEQALNVAESAVAGTTVEYALANSETVAPTTGWNITSPTRTPGTFIWTRTTIAYGDGSTTRTSPVLLTGNAGATGTSVASVAPYFAQVATGSTAPDKPTAATPPSPWSATEPTWIVDTSLYRTEKVTYSDETFAYTTVQLSTAYEAATSARNAAIAAQEAAEGAAAVAADAILVANGKSSSWWSQELPGNAPGEEGDSWFVLDSDNNLKELWKHDGVAWTRSMIDGVSIVAESITGDQIHANAILAEHLTAGSVQAEHIVSNTLLANLLTANIANFASVWSGKIGTNELAAQAITAEKIKASSITTDKLVVGAGANLMPDPDFTTTAIWPTVVGTIVPDAGRVAGQNGFVIPAGTAQRGQYSTSWTPAGLIPVNPGDQYRISVWVKPDADAPAYSLSLYPGTHQTPNDTRVLASPNRIDAPATAAGQWVQISGLVTIPADRYWLGLGVFLQSNYTGSATFSHVSVTSAVDGSLIVDGAINGKTIVGADIFATPPGNYSKTAVPRVHIGNSVIEVVRGKEGEPEAVSLALGGSTADRMQLFDADGDVLAGFDESGAGSALSFETGELQADTILVDGSPYVGAANDIVPLASIVNDKARGVVPGGWWRGGTGTAQIKFGNSEYGLYEMPVFLPGGRFYSIKYTGLISASAAGFIFLKYRFTSSGAGSPGAPKITSPIVGAGTFPVVAGYNWIDFDVRVPGWQAEGWYRILLTGQSGVSGMTGQTYGVDANPSSWAIIDEGPQAVRSYVAVSSGGGTPPSGQTNTDPVEVQARTYTGTWNASWVRSWQGGNLRTDYARQGYYGGNHNRSMLGIPQAMINALRGSTITSLSITMVNRSFYYGSGGKARYALATTPNTGTAIGAPGPSTYFSNNVTKDSAQWTAGTKKTTAFPSSFFGGFQNGTVGAITMGEGSGTVMDYYSKYSNKLSDIVFKATYEK